ncbi:methylated-DNA--[protein]-cysteine S-methyltransferase [Pseudomonas sp. 10B1]|uniref:methylated-DNA--[protein]-cysteine S-methyltransferase n=1 Tax=unclassified Pseudomonas TaxID=196821 RepID=UPI002AB553C3|nr:MULTISPECIES: methylated-DNA--[protein]-cysteine S-methyltransferase [unclassified Pseudomonas]MDY7561992.1 methylated-DNA--[protein]-cysteine S-methyltransferase [Pseudomonas sp. AB6]MEA9975980.1 methylated-DNA--[protein]-cysteine S-methyltransferase [Pseudomonas sp. RTS4]MEA9993514.1 methylated-DNA--[protein]-cysteine S-methyltransferase [Pseudomonas sp. AA4]MEB0088623.1 methylated-DNA--[protein]-cysteine S-methyltransferase [Pseudomonas sp. RTI1]MEB0126213.1 methylated-DNA--[protein]-cys
MSQGYIAASPLGDIALRVEDDALTGVFFVGQKYYPDLVFTPDELSVPKVVSLAREQLDEFFKGERRVFNLPLVMRGTPFQRLVWQQLSLIPYGEIVSYGTLAKSMGLSSGHSRAVGTANGRNPISIIIPCHRVIGGGGGLTGYAGGVDRKQALLSLENMSGRLVGFEFELVSSNE